VLLLDGTVADNIAYGRPDASPEEIGELLMTKTVLLIT